MKIGYNQATALKCSTLETDLRVCEKVGFDYIEIRMDMLREYLCRHSVDELAAFFATSRLKPHAMNAFYLYPQFLGPDDDPVKRQALLDEILLGCNVAKAIGSRAAIVVAPLIRDPAAGPYQGTWDETFRECVRILRQLSDIYRFYDMNICFEMVGVNRCSVRSIEQAKTIVEAVDRDNVGYVFDAYNLYMYEQSNDFSAIETVDPDRIFAAHIMNADPAPASGLSQENRRFPDQGILDLGNFLSCLKRAGYNGMVSVETFRPEYWEMDPETVITEAYRTTREVLAANGCLD